MPSLFLTDGAALQPRKERSSNQENYSVVTVALLIHLQNCSQISHSLSVLGWYIPGLSGLPLGQRLLRLLAGPFQRFFPFSISFALSVMFLFFLLSLRVRACTQSTAPRAIPAPSCVSAGGGGGGIRGVAKEHGPPFWSRVPRDTTEE